MPAFPAAAHRGGSWATSGGLGPEAEAAHGFGASALLMTEQRIEHHQSLNAFTGCMHDYHSLTTVIVGGPDRIGCEPAEIQTVIFSTIYHTGSICAMEFCLCITLALSLGPKHEATTPRSLRAQAGPTDTRMSHRMRFPVQHPYCRPNLTAAWRAILLRHAA